MFNLWNFLAYQCAWFAVILGAAHGMPQAGAAVAVLVAAVHLALRRERVELQLIAAAFMAGVVVDTVSVISGQVHFASAWPPSWSPFWMLSLWIAFATTLNHSLRWLMTRPLAAAVAGAIGGPLAYLAGARLGALAMVVLHGPRMPRARRQPA